MAEDKDLLTWKQIGEKLKSLKKDEDKINFLKKFVKDKDYSNLKRKVVKHLAPLIEKKKPLAQYEITYDSLQEGLEPIYFWVLDFMQDKGPSGIGLDVIKTEEAFEASTSSGYFGEIGQRATLMQQKVMEYMGAINQVIKSILQLLYDLKDFEIRLEMYDNIQKFKRYPKGSKERNEYLSAKYNLKGVWMDQVDVKNGMGSINSMAQQLNFVTLRDAFFYTEKLEEIDRLDLNDRVKRILKKKFYEYQKWVEHSEKEIRKRYAIERAYLKSQVGTLKQYASWAKPYLKAANKLKMKEFNTAAIVNAFSNMEMEISLLGKKEIKPSSVHLSFGNLTLERKYYSVLKIDMHFRTLPTAVAGQGGRHYIHGGRTDIIFKSYAFDDIEMDVMESKELYDDLDLLEDYVSVSLEELDKELQTYLNPPKKEKKPQSPPLFSEFKLTNPFKGTFVDINEIIKPFKMWDKRTSSRHALSEIKSTAESSAKSTCYRAYDVYKKTHGMITYP